MKLKGIFAALLLVVAGVQTAAAQGFRVYKSDGTVAQFSLRADSIVFYDGIGTDVDFGPFTPVNQCISGTWYKSKNETVTFREDGTTDYVEGANYEFMPYQGTIIINNASGMPVNILKVHKVTSEMLVVSTLGSDTFSVWNTAQPVQLVTSITISPASLSLQLNEASAITATVLPSDADNKELEWASSNEAVAVVGDFFGTITVMAKDYGTCTVIATAKDDSGVKAECEVTVQAAKEQTFTVNGVSFKMKNVTGGVFQMGSISDDSNEKPAHQVTLNSFSIGQTEVTQELWKAVMGSNPSSVKGDKLPVEKVSWNDCQTFITKLNQMTGKTFRLPTEAEWEFAARGGNLSKGYTYSGSNTIDDVAWYISNSSKSTHQVGTRAPNELGIYDMSGNVWEWCQDWYSSSYYSESSENNPKGPSSGSNRVLRGGSWNFIAAYCRVAHRDFSTPSNSYGDYGLRLAL